MAPVPVLLGGVPAAAAEGEVEVVELVEMLLRPRAAAAVAPLPLLPLGEARVALVVVVVVVVVEGQEAGAGMLLRGRAAGVLPLLTLSLGRTGPALTTAAEALMLLRG